MALLTAISDAEWRLISDEGNPVVDGYKLTRMTAFINATVADTIFATAVALDTVVSPVADGQTYSGTFAMNKVTMDEGRDDNNQRYCNLIEDLTLVSAVANIAALVALNAIIIQDNEILNLFGITAELGEGDGIVYIYHNINPTERANCMGLSDSDLVSNLPGAGWSYLSREFKVMEDNTARFMVVFKKAAWVNTSGSTPNRVLATQITVGQTNHDPQNDKYGFDSAIRYQSDGVPTAAAAEILENQVAGGTNFIVDASMQDKGHGEHAISKQEIRKRATTDQFARRWSQGFAGRPTSETLMWKNLTSTDATTIYDNAKTNFAAMASATPAAPANHVLLSVDRIPRQGVSSGGLQMFDVMRVTYIPIWGTATDDWDNYKDEWQWIEVQWRRVEVGAYPVNQFRRITHIKYVLLTRSRSAAYDFPTDGNSAGVIPIPGGGNKFPIDANVSPLSGGRFFAWSECASATGWTAYADGTAWTNLGNGV